MSRNLAERRKAVDHSIMPEADSPRRPRSNRNRSAAPPSPPQNAESPWAVLRSVTLHPFIYKKMLGAVDPSAVPGNIVNVYDRGGILIGRGLFNPRSQIVIRMLTRDGRPVDDAFWGTTIERAVALRRLLRIDEATDAYRLIHAEGDGLSGLIVERYADCLVFEIFSIGIYQRVELLVRLLSAALGGPASQDRPGRAVDQWRVFVRADAAIQRTEGFEIDPAFQPDLGRVIIREHGVRFRVDVAAGHKTGFFCDQRENRLRLALVCRDADVLDLCCYTGGFGLAARLLGGAKEVTSVDLDEAALELAKENARLNNTRLSIVHSDAFNYLRQLIANRRLFDVVVLDPPKLAASRGELDDALRKYHDLNRLAVQTVRPGGVFLTCSCSGLVAAEAFRETVQRAARIAGRPLQAFAETGAAPDHPVLSNCPESAYLKALWFRVL